MLRRLGGKDSVRRSERLREARAGPEDSSEDAEVHSEAVGRQVDGQEAGEVMEARAAARVEEVGGLGAAAVAVPEGVATTVEPAEMVHLKASPFHSSRFAVESNFLLSFPRDLYQPTPQSR